MTKKFGTVFLALSVWAGALALPAVAQAKDMTGTATSAAVAAARTETGPSKVRRARKVGTRQLRRVATVAARGRHHPQCFPFWCGGGDGRPFSWLILGVAY